jgi:hypothetical protein
MVFPGLQLPLPLQRVALVLEAVDRLPPQVVTRAGHALTDEHAVALHTLEVGHALPLLISRTSYVYEASRSCPWNIAWHTPHSTTRSKILSSPYLA